MFKGSNKNQVLSSTDRVKLKKKHHVLTVIGFKLGETYPIIVNDNDTLSVEINQKMVDIVAKGSLTEWSDYFAKVK